MFLRLAGGVAKKLTVPSSKLEKTGSASSQTITPISRMQRVIVLVIVVQTARAVDFK